ncbi:MAG: hypothetical protein GX625_08430 [Clostridiaceae bacterium]|nr:hypothetical protein [Clostridiaceae bacterium]
MNYIAVKDLKNSKSLREKLEKERELILTKDGQPFALMVGISADSLEESIREIRRALFSKAITRGRKKAIINKIDETDIASLISDSRKSRIK